MWRGVFFVGERGGLEGGFAAVDGWGFWNRYAMILFPFSNFLTRYRSRWSGLREFKFTLITLTGMLLHADGRLYFGSNTSPTRIITAIKSVIRNPHMEILSADLSHPVESSDTFPSLPFSSLMDLSSDRFP